MKKDTQPNRRMKPSITYNPATHLFELSLSGPDELSDERAENIARQIKDAPTNQTPVSLTPAERIDNLSKFFPKSADKIRAKLKEL